MLKEDKQMILKVRKPDNANEDMINLLKNYFNKKKCAYYAKLVLITIIDKETCYLIIINYHIISEFGDFCCTEHLFNHCIKTVRIQLVRNFKSMTYIHQSSIKIIESRMF